MGGLDEFASKWQEANGLGNGRSRLPPSQRSYLELKRTIDGLQMVVGQEWYTLKALSDDTPGLPASAVAIAKSATDEVLNDDGVLVAISTDELSNSIRHRGSGKALTLRAEQEYRANEYKKMELLYFSYSHTLVSLKLAEMKILPQVYSIAAENGFWYQVFTRISFCLYALVVVIGLLRDTWGGEKNRQSEKGNRPTLEKMACVLGDIDARLKTMEGK